MSTPNYREEFEKFLMTEHPAAAGDKLPEVQQHVKDMYFSEYEGCVPDHMLGEDTMQDVKDKFYYPLSFIRSLFVAKHPELKGKICIVIDASYESDTHYIMYADSKILFDYAVEAWKFVFDHDIDFKEEVEYVLGKMEEAYKPATLHAVIDLTGGVLQEVTLCEDEADAEKVFKEATGVDYPEFVDRTTKPHKIERDCENCLPDKAANECMTCEPADRVEEPSEVFDDEDTDVQLWELQVQKGAKAK